MRNKIPCFIPTMVTIVMLTFAATIGTTAGVVQGAIESQSECTEEMVSDTSEDHIQEIVYDEDISEYTPQKNEITEYSPEPPTDVTEPPTASQTVLERVIYYDVPLSEDLQDYIFNQCEKLEVDPALIIGIIVRESKCDASAIGDSGRSLGLMQIQPRWHYNRMVAYDCHDLLDAYDNVTVGIDYFAHLYYSSGSLEWALTCYNGGSGRANRYRDAGVTSTYASDVIYIAQGLSTYEVLKG